MLWMDALSMALCRSSAPLGIHASVFLTVLVAFLSSMFEERWYHVYPSTDPLPTSFDANDNALQSFLLFILGRGPFLIPSLGPSGS